MTSSTNTAGLRVVVVIEDLNDTGANRVTLDRAQHWRRSGSDVTVFVAAVVGGASLPIPSGLRMQRGSTGRRLATVLPVSFVRLLRLARGADVVVAGTEVGFGLLLTSLVTRIVRRPFAVTVQSEPAQAIANYVEPRLRGLTRAALGDADLAVCVAHGLVASTQRLTSRVAAVPNAVPRAEISRAAELEPTVGWDRSLPLVVGVGRLVHQKGFDLLVHAHRQALAGGAPPHTLMIIGDGDPGPLLRLAEELGVADSVILPGFAQNPHAIVSRASAFVLSSRWEGFSLCLAEALACGTACLAFDCAAGPAEVLDGGRHGLLLPPEDVTALAAALHEHLVDPAPLAARAASASRDESPIFDPAGAAAGHLRELAALAGR